MISAMPAVAVRREREKNRQGKLIGDPFARGSYIAGHQLHHLPTSYYHPHHLHHHHHNSSNQQGNKSIDRNHNSSDCVNISSEDKNGLTFLIYSGFGCLAIGLIFLLIGIVTIKLPSQIIGLVFIGLGGLFCVIKVILNGKSSSSSSSLSSPPRATTTTTTTRVETNCDGVRSDNVDNNLNLIRSSINQPLIVDSKQTVKLPNSPKSMNNSMPTEKSADCLNQTSSKSIDQQYLEAS